MVTLLLSVLPVSKAAGEEETIPVNNDPLPIKKLPAVIFPVAEIAEFPINVPVTVIPAAVTATTLAVPVGLINMAPLKTMLTLLVPLAIPLTPPVANN